ncbi:MAG: U32 family peptidase [Spirochaetota bacterium]|nr:U32 family peptidase [Spirochaetota bacterium]
MELLAPAGDLEKLRVAFAYGADAVYLAGEAFGLRSAAGNFSLKEIERGARHARSLNRKVYLALNIYPTNSEIDRLIPYLKSLNSIVIDGLIVADAGVFSLVKEITDFPIHLSTQASITNSAAVKFWVEQGARRVVLAREVSISEARQIKEQLNIELEMFIHGSMCMSYSGKCSISNYTALRDANRGGCVNSCRWEYALSSDTSQNPFSKSFVMNSRDLSAVGVIQELINAGIDSLKIEGRMKSHLYLSTTVSCYRQMLDCFLEDRMPTEKDYIRWTDRLNSLPNRGFSDGFLQGAAGKDSILYENVKTGVKSSYVGIVKDVLSEMMMIDVKNPFAEGDMLGFQGFDGEVISYEVKEIRDVSGARISQAKVNSLVGLKKDSNIKKLTVALKLSDSEKPMNNESFKFNAV